MKPVKPSPSKKLIQDVKKNRDRCIITIKKKPGNPGVYEIVDDCGVTVHGVRSFHLRNDGPDSVLTIEINVSEFEMRTGDDTIDY